MFNTMTSNSLYSSDKGMHIRMSAVTLFMNVLNRGKWALLLHNLVGKQNQLPVLSRDENLANSKQKSSNRPITVSLDKIVGSESRVHDFDRHFRPLVHHTRDRWVGIVMAHLQGIPLPPVELIQDRDEYYVRDGHHRISVAKTFGQAAIEACIVGSKTNYVGRSWR